MRVTHGRSRAGGAAVAVTIGNFDGVHKGHQAMVARLLEQARARGLESCVLTFEPHPREYFERMRSGGREGGSRAAPARLTSLREKLELLASTGVERVHLERFSREFASLEPQQFIDRVLVERLRARWVLVGGDFCFGARRAGDTKMLAESGRERGFGVDIMPAVMQGGTRISSGAVRLALSEGDLGRARDLLGRPYSISGRVVAGDRLGRELGFPTANIQLKHNRSPLTGIFAVRVAGVAPGRRDAVASLGVRPTVKAGAAPVLEVHLFDFEGDLYGRHVRVDFLHKLREEEKFADLETLRLQIARDCGAARAYLSDHRDE